MEKTNRIVQMQIVVAEQHFFKRCGYAVVEVFSSSCGTAIADVKISCAYPPLE
jgi:hypothetical protein